MAHLVLKVEMVRVLASVINVPESDLAQVRSERGLR